MSTTTTEATDCTPPAILPLIVENLPLADLAPYRQFVAWELKRRGNSWTKPPKNPHTGAYADCGDPGDPQTWGTWDDVFPRYERAGFVPTRNDPFTFLDCDNAINSAGHIKPWARAIVNRFPRGYWEYSPSGTGLKGFVRGHVAENKIFTVDDGQLEVFSCGKFSTLTGHRIAGSNETIGDGQAALEALIAEFCSEPEPQPITPSPELDADDRTIIERVLRLPKGRQLHGAGDTTGYTSASEADLALLNCYVKAGVTCPDRLEALYDQAALDNPHWQKADYRKRTIAKACDGYVEPFDWNRPVATIVRPGTTEQLAAPAGDPCEPVRDELAELRAENARLLAENAQVKRDLSAVIKVIGNPNLGGDAAGKALVLAATYVQAQRARVHSDDGYYRVTASKVADNKAWVDGEDGERIPVPVPAQVAPRTVTKYMAIAQERGLIPAEKRTVRVPKGQHDFPVDIWHWKAAPTLADQLAPLTGGTVYDEDNPRPVRGGDPKQRRIVPIPGCPECGGHHVACVTCAATFNTPAAIDLDTRETLTTDEADQQLAERRHTVPTRARPTKSVATRPLGETSLQSASPDDPRPTVPAGEAERKKPESARVTAWRARFARAADDLRAREQGRAVDPDDASTVGRAENQPLPSI